jgi:hypothetical protein
MKLFIQIENGSPINHPALEENLIQAFGAVPSDWEPYERADRPQPTAYQVLESGTPIRQKFAGVWKEIWLLRNMTNAEIAAKQQATKDAWTADPQSANWAGWVFNELGCEFYPPVPHPGLPNYRWCGAENNWKEAPVQPTEGGPYKFDYFQWVWVPV